MVLTPFLWQHDFRLLWQHDFRRLTFFAATTRRPMAHYKRIVWLIGCFQTLNLVNVSAVNAASEYVLTASGENSAPAEDAPRTATESLQRLEKVAQGEGVHPLLPWIQYATARYQYVRDNVRDHSCVLIKRERIRGVLSDYQYVFAKSRYQQVRGEKVVVPLSVYLHYIAPAKVRGRKVVYVAGQNDNKILVRNGGRRFSFVKVKIDPHSDAALRQSHYPITELGMDNVIKRMLDRANQDMSADPSGENTTVKYFRDAKINKRACIHVRVVHPQRQAGLSFHRAEIYIDDQLQVPVRIEAYDWPRKNSPEPKLIEEFTYTQLKFNVGFRSADFLPQVLDSSSAK